MKPQSKRDATFSFRPLFDTPLDSLQRGTCKASNCPHVRCTAGLRMWAILGRHLGHSPVPPGPPPAHARHLDSTLTRFEGTSNLRQETIPPYLPFPTSPLKSLLPQAAVTVLYLISLLTTTGTLSEGKPQPTTHPELATCVTAPRGLALPTFYAHLGSLPWAPALHLHAHVCTHQHAHTRPCAPGLQPFFSSSQTEAPMCRGASAWNTTPTFCQVRPFLNHASDFVCSDFSEKSSQTSQSNCSL